MSGPAPEAPAVRVEAADVMLGGRPVLRGVTLGVSAGEVVALLGANGSGKSTLVRTVLGLVPLRRGRVELFGEPLSRFGGWRRVGYVPQRSTASSGVPASVWEVVASGRLAHRPPWRPMSREDRRLVRQALAEVALADRVRDSVATLSGGQQQRVLIARALAGQPDLLVLDEPTAGVDVASQATLAEVMGRLVDRGTTILLVAHELGPLAPLIDRTVVLRDGRVAYDGAPLESFEHLPAPHHHGPDAFAGTPPGPVGRTEGTSRPMDVATPVDRAADRSLR